MHQQALFVITGDLKITTGVVKVDVELGRPVSEWNRLMTPSLYNAMPINFRLCSKITHKSSVGVCQWLHDFPTYSQQFSRLYPLC